MYYKNKILMICGIAIAGFIITNPSLTSFKEYLGVNYSAGLSRKSNYYIFSKFKYHNKYYLGILGNFFLLSQVKSNSERHNEISMTDTAQKYPNSEVTIEYEQQGDDLLDSVVKKVLKGKLKKYSPNDLSAKQVDSILKGIN
jgi:hypothetical protein